VNTRKDQYAGDKLFGFVSNIVKGVLRDCCHQRSRFQCVSMMECAILTNPANDGLLSIMEAPLAQCWRLGYSLGIHVGPMYECEHHRFRS